MIKTLAGLAAATLLLAGCSGEKGGAKQAQADRTEGPVVSASETPRNPAVDTTPTTGDSVQTAGASSFTEGQARKAIETAGFTNVGPLTQNQQGLWQGTATRDGAAVKVSVDYKGAVNQL